MLFDYSGGGDMERFLTGNLEGVFSVAVAAYLLVRMEQKLDALTQAIVELRIHITTGDIDVKKTL